MPTIFDGAIFFLVLTLGIMAFAATVFSAIYLEKISKILERVEKLLSDREKSH